MAQPVVARRCRSSDGPDVAICVDHLAEYRAVDCGGTMDVDERPGHRAGLHDAVTEGLDGPDGDAVTVCRPRARRYPSVLEFRSAAADCGRSDLLDRRPP